MTDSDDETYKNDPRIPCKYGKNCYQKNAAHNAKFKHPRKESIQSTKHIAKKRKVETDDHKIKQIPTDKNCESDSESSSHLGKKPHKIRVSNDVSDSDEEAGENNIAKPKLPDVTSNADTTNDIDSQMDEKPTPNERQMTGIITDCRQFIKDKFLVDMPEDFYTFWELAQKLQPKAPTEAFKDIGLTLVGPYDVLAGNFNNIAEKTASEYLTHWRYYYDPPEFQTVLKGDDKTGFHIGYFRDVPNDLPVFLAYNHGMRDGEIVAIGDNLFAAVLYYLEKLNKNADPFKKIQIARFQTLLRKRGEELSYDLTKRSTRMVERERKIVARSFNKIGLVVPYDRKSQLGYRGLTLNNSDFKTLLNKLQYADPAQKNKYLSDLQPLFTFATIAADEGDFGTGLELGWDIIAHGIDSLNSTAIQHLASSYNLLNRNIFAQIAEAHLRNRRKSCDLSIL